MQIVADRCRFVIFLCANKLWWWREGSIVYHSGGHCNYITGEYLSVEVMLFLCFFFPLFSPLGYCPFAVQLAALACLCGGDTCCDLPRGHHGEALGRRGVCWGREMC